MTLSEILLRLRQVKIKSLSFTQTPSGGTMVLSYKDLEKFRLEILSLIEIPVLKPEFEELLNHEIFQTNRDVFTLPTDEGYRLNHLVDTRIAMVRGLLKILPSLIPEPREDCIRIRLPDSQDYRGVVADQEIILKALEQLLFIKPEFTKPISIQGWENGTLWLNLCLGAAVAVELVGRAVWAAAVIRKKMHEGSIIEEQVRAMKVENNFLEHLNSKAKQAVDAVVEIEALGIYDKYFKGEQTHEEIERIKHTLKTLASLIDRGAEVHPALMQPEKAKELFPDFKVLNTISSQIKQLKEKTDAE